MVAVFYISAISSDVNIAIAQQDVADAWKPEEGYLKGALGLTGDLSFGRTHRDLSSKLPTTP